ncbi:unnamed protein product [Peronospora destructor]|uniref:Mitochondrial import inner membrane translocase subunit Tim21 n=1 Tax=Peronospora destructor TaxID=86335 RepID=A0AAV0V5T4_9STRA|nr:unnamed protein product [Peronospora destructor]
MSSSCLIRRCISPLPAARVRACTSPYISPSVLSSSVGTFSVSRSRFAVHASSSSLLLSRPDSILHRNVSSVLILQSKRFYSSEKKPWQNDNNWKSTLKTGGLVLLGTGALIASTSLAFGLIIAGAAGFGVYTVYQRFFGPYRSSFRSSDPFSNVNSNIDTLNDLFRRNRHDKLAGHEDLSSLVQGLPLIVRGFVKTMFVFVGKTMQSSMERAGELKRQTTEHLQGSERVRDDMGGNVSVGGPVQWMESTMNGAGHIEAVFPVNGTSSSARVTVKAFIGQEGNLNLTELKYRNRQTGEMIDLLRDSSAGGRKKSVIDAEFVDLDGKNGRSRW